MFILYYVTLIVLYIFIIIIHGFGSILLIKQHRQQQNVGNMQCIFLINLSCTEILANCLRILCIPLHHIISIPSHLMNPFAEVQRYSFIIANTGIYLLYLSSMAYITLNRFFEVKLNIKYNIYCTIYRLKFLLITTWVFCIVTCISLSLVDVFNPFLIFILMDSYLVYIYASLEVVFLLLAITTYVFIFKKFKESRKHPSQYGHRGSGKKNSDGILKIFSASRFYIFILLTLNFVFFVIVPQLVHFFVSEINRSDGSIAASMVRDVLMAISDVGDAFIYIILDKSIKMRGICFNANKNGI